MLALVRHPRVVQYFGVVRLPLRNPEDAAATTLLPSSGAAAPAASASAVTAATRLYLVMEFAPGGSIADALAKVRPPFLSSPLLSLAAPLLLFAHLFFLLFP